MFVIFKVQSTSEKMSESVKSQFNRLMLLAISNHQVKVENGLESFVH